MMTAGLLGDVELFQLAIKEEIESRYYKWVIVDICLNNHENIIKIFPHGKVYNYSQALSATKNKQIEEIIHNLAEKGGIVGVYRKGLLGPPLSPCYNWHEIGCTFTCCKISESIPVMADPPWGLCCIHHDIDCHCKCCEIHENKPKKRTGLLPLGRSQVDPNYIIKKNMNQHGKWEFKPGKLDDSIGEWVRKHG